MLLIRGAGITDVWSAPERFLCHPIGLLGYDLPDIHDMEIHKLGPNKSNIVLCPRNLAPPEIDFINNASANVFVFGPATRRSGVITCNGTGNLMIIAGFTPWHSHYNLHLDAADGTFFFGKGSTSTDANIFVKGDRSHVIIGEDCMLSHAVMIRTHDQHIIFDTETGEWINPPENVLIEPHVWLGQETLVLKGVTIGAGSVISARSTVIKNVPRKVVVAGSPTVIIKTNTSWAREATPDDDTRTRWQSAFERFGFNP